MSISSEQSVSVWMASADMPTHERLTEDDEAEFCIVGAGIAGLSTAYLLAREGRSVIVLDAKDVGVGQTQRTSAHLSSALDDRFTELEKVHGQRAARLAAESHAAAIDRIEAICKEEQIDCDFERVAGYLFSPPGEPADLLHNEMHAAQRAGLRVEMVERAPLGTFHTGPALRFSDQAQFHPLKYLAGLDRAIARLGGRIYTNTHAARVEGGEKAHVETNDGPVVRAGAIVVATNTPINDLVAIHTKQAPYMTYVIGAQILRGSAEQALYWDTLDPYHYVRLQPLNVESDLLIVGGEDHKVGQAQDQVQRWNRLEQWARERWPQMGGVEYRWSGMVMETVDGLAFIGRNPLDDDNVFLATGDSGMGLTHGTVAGMLLCDLLSGRENEWSEIYEPTRKPVWGMAWKEFLSENLNVAGQYVKDWVAGGEAEPELPGTAAVVRRGARLIAVHVDEQGTRHERSAVCPHLGCIVHWNGAENTWDCPCHGSRFDGRGNVVNGPTNSPLAEPPS